MARLTLSIYTSEVAEVVGFVAAGTHGWSAARRELLRLELQGLAREGRLLDFDPVMDGALTARASAAMLEALRRHGLPCPVLP